MISKSQVKHIRSLEDKKNRYAFSQFVIEGEKMIAELLNSTFEIVSIYGTENWAEKQQASGLDSSKLTLINEAELRRISSLKSPNEVLAIVSMPHVIDIPGIKKAIALDHIQDPGNLGSIIRIADWFGIQHILCSEQTVDVYNPKVLQASMGSIFRVQCHYTDLENYFTVHPDIPKYACVLDGCDVRQIEGVHEGIVVIGNESKGISHALISFCQHRISIARLGQAESLNAAIAAGIVCHSLWK